MNMLVPRETVDQLVNKRAATLTAFRACHTRLIEAQVAIAEANGLMRLISPQSGNSYNRHTRENEEFYIRPIKVLDEADYVAKVEFITSVNLWAKLTEHTELESIMNRRQKDELRSALITDPPEPTVENIFATLQARSAGLNHTIQEGIADVFTALDRRFRSNDTFKFKHRIVLDNALSQFGGWNHGWRYDDTLMDVERIFRFMEDMPAVAASIVHCSSGRGCHTRVLFSRASAGRH